MKIACMAQGAAAAAVFPFWEAPTLDVMGFEILCHNFGRTLRRQSVVIEHQAVGGGKFAKTTASLQDRIIVDTTDDRLKAGDLFPDYNATDRIPFMKHTRRELERRERKERERLEERHSFMWRAPSTQSPIESTTLPTTTSPSRSGQD